MRLMSFLIPLCKQSQKIRDLFIEMLRRAMYQRDSATRQMGVYGFCLVLKHLRENNARRATSGHVLASIGGGGGGGATQQQRMGYVFTQQSISGYSLMSQSMLIGGSGGGGADDNPQRHFDLLALEIIGVLRKCFNQTYEVKAVLYAGLYRAIDFNSRLTPHIVQFLEWHFHKYFEPSAGAGDEVPPPAAVAANADDSDVLVFRLGDVLRELDGALSVWDHLGHLVQLMGHCVCVGRRKGMANEVRAVGGRLDALLRRMVELNAEETVGLVATGGVMDAKVAHLGGQLLNCLEALMGYAVWSHGRRTEPVAGDVPVAGEEEPSLAVVLRLFKQHRTVMEMLRAANVPPKRSAKAKNAASGSTQEAPGAARRPVVFEPVNIWELATLERMLRVVFE